MLQSYKDCTQLEHETGHETKATTILYGCLAGEYWVRGTKLETEFWFAAPDATSGHTDQPIFLNLSAYDDSAYVTASQPANGAFTPINVGIPANDSRRIDLTAWIADIETTQPDVILQTGLHIMATNKISADYEMAPSNNTDIFL
ncbi:MAG: hypothetical protein U5L96_02375 [Owenweeksia sp.]|nr:hypothetical protein [Owenweeksia sp.]